MDLISITSILTRFGHLFFPPVEHWCAGGGPTGLCIVRYQTMTKTPYEMNHNPVCFHYSLKIVFFQSIFHAHDRCSVVVLHPDNDLLLHCKPGSLPDGGEDGVPHRVCRGPGQAAEDQIRGCAGGLNICLLQGEFLLLVQPCRPEYSTKIRFFNLEL